MYARRSQRSEHLLSHRFSEVGIEELARSTHGTVALEKSAWPWRILRMLAEESFSECRFPL